MTLLETIVVIVVIGVLVTVLIPRPPRDLSRAYFSRAMMNQRQILLGLNTYATDHNGQFPTGVDGNAMSSQDAFNELIPEYIDTEIIFWIKTNNPDKRLPPLEDGKLEANETPFLYVTKQSTKSRKDSPLVADGEMSRPGFYNEYHPWLKSQKAVVGFVGGHVQEHPLTSSEPGATAKDIGIGTMIDNIFKGREDGGLLDTDPQNILLPE